MQRPEKRAPRAAQISINYNNIFTAGSSRASKAKYLLIRLLIVVGFLWFCSWSEFLIGERSPFDDLGDGMHKLFSPINITFHSNPKLADFSIAAISFLVDVAGVSLIICSIFGGTCRPLIGLVVLYLFRQTVEMLSRIPAPEGMIWRYPGFPSLFVDYHVMNDFFFSGHTAMIVYAAAEISQLRRRWAMIMGIIAYLFVVVVLFSLRAHYTMDVYAGTISAILAFFVASWGAKILDPIFGNRSDAPKIGR